MNQHQIKNIFQHADLLVDIGNHGAWLKEAHQAEVPAVLVDGEPGYTQMKMEKLLQENQELPNFDYYFSNGANIGLDSCTSPTAGKKWHHVYNPIVVNLFPNIAIQQNLPISTIMNWQSHADFDFEGKSYGQKDVEFNKFIELPSKIKIPIEIAVAGSNVPFKNLKKNGWKIIDAHKVTRSVESYYNYISYSLAEFSICKNAYVSTHSGWFSDRSAAYLANSRPVILQDTGFSEHIPCGRGLFAVNNIEDAVCAIEEVTGDYNRQAKWAKEIALNYLDSKIILKNFLKTLSI